MIVCHVRYAEIADAARAGTDVLEPAEWARALRFRRSADRQRFIAGRGLIKALVAEIAGVKPVHVTVRMQCVHCGSDAHGKPSAIHPAGTQAISIAHSAERVLVAVTTGPQIGVDLEVIDERHYSDGLLDQVEAPLERGTTPRNPAAFTRLWAHKEAVLKCTGDGLMVSPKQLTIDFAGPNPAILDWPVRTHSVITIRTLQMPGPYSAAVAVATDKAVAINMERTVY